MSSKLKLSLVAVSALALAAPGCCIPGLLCGHSNSNEEVVVGSYSTHEGISYSNVSSDCPHCNAAATASVLQPTAAVPTSVEPQTDNGSFLINQPTVDANSPYANPSSDSGKTFGTLGNGNVLDAISPPNSLETPAENMLPGNILPLK